MSQVIGRKSFECKDPYMGSWFPFTVEVSRNKHGELVIDCKDQFGNGAIFVEYETGEEPISIIEQAP